MSPSVSKFDKSVIRGRYTFMCRCQYLMPTYPPFVCYTYFCLNVNVLFRPANSNGKHLIMCNCQYPMPTYQSFRTDTPFSIAVSIPSRHTQSLVAYTHFRITVNILYRNNSHSQQATTDMSLLVSDAAFPGLSWQRFVSMIEVTIIGVK